MGPLDAVLEECPLDLRLRLRVAQPVDQRPEGASREFVLCWLQQSLRLDDNPLIEACIYAAEILDLPILVYHGISQSYPHASDRLHRFILGASRDVAQACQRLGLQYLSYVETPQVQAKGLVFQLADQAALVFTDDQPCFVGRWQLERFSSKTKTPCLAVDANSLVPRARLRSRLSTTKAFRAAHTSLRTEFELNTDRKSGLNTIMAAVDHPARKPFTILLPFRSLDLAAATDQHLEQIVSSCAIDHSVPASMAFPADRKTALARFASFVEHDLSGYASRRNTPADENGSARISPYLHFGVVGPRELVAQVRVADASAQSKWKFLDELLTWREWFHYLAARFDCPESYENLPSSARRTLEAHADDPRDIIYDLSALIHGETQDETWNAAQRQWLATGYMHNNLRMYWAKKLIGWTSSPQSAWITACYLNDRFSLDGRDPATYGNMQWVFGRAKPSYREQPVYGWVSQKTDRALRKRDGMNDWLSSSAQRLIPRVSVPDNAWLAYDFDRRVVA